MPVGDVHVDDDVGLGHQTSPARLLDQCATSLRCGSWARSRELALLLAAWFTGGGIRELSMRKRPNIATEYRLLNPRSCATGISAVVNSEVGRFR
jgi:hypothetical protein